mmetsp:Transcript_11044/g.13305  ORF Transcript_11044/g.13305 Transcript_11044/m.13305 type:complete len:163 (+) Transcript_11044:87-575(+)
MPPRNSSTADSWLGTDIERTFGCMKDVMETERRNLQRENENLRNKLNEAQNEIRRLKMQQQKRIESEDCIFSISSEATTVLASNRLNHSMESTSSKPFIGSRESAAMADQQSSKRRTGFRLGKKLFQTPKSPKRLGRHPSPKKGRNAPFMQCCSVPNRLAEI